METKKKIFGKYNNVCFSWNFSFIVQYVYTLCQMQNEQKIIMDEIRGTGLRPDKSLCCVYDSVY